jgi:hypothetical protein
MIFGDPERFAVEIYHEPSGPKWRGCGRMWLHLGGTLFGDIGSRHCSLFHAVDRFRELLGWSSIGQPSKDVESFWDASFRELDDVQVFALLDRERFLGPVSGCLTNPGKFDFLTNTGEMFDSTKSFIVCDPDSGVRILFQIYNLGDETTKACALGLDEFRGIAESLVHWFDELPDPAVPPFFPVESGQPE